MDRRASRELVDGSANPAGEPADGAHVFVFKQVYRDGRRLCDAVRSTAGTNDRGEYRLGNLKPGRYIVRADNARDVVNNRYDRPPNAFYDPVFYPNAATEDQAVPGEVGVGAEV